MEDNTWIKLYRRVKNNSFCYRNAERLGFWAFLLSTANHADADFFIGLQKVHCKPGQFAAGRKKLSIETGVSEMKVERWLSMLEKEQQIEQQSFTKYRIITIKNWSDYQLNEQQKKQQTNNKRTTNEQQTNTNKKNNNEKNEIRNIHMSENEIDLEFPKFVEFVSNVLNHKKNETPEALKKWKARRKNFSAREISEAFFNLQNEPDQWKLKNLAYKQLSWWLRSDDYIRELQNCHLKKSSSSKNFIIA